MQHALIFRRVVLRQPEAHGGFIAKASRLTDLLTQKKLVALPELTLLRLLLTELF